MRRTGATEGRALEANPGLMPGTLYGLLSTDKSDP